MLGSLVGVFPVTISDRLCFMDFGEKPCHPTPREGEHSTLGPSSETPTLLNLSPWFIRPWAGKRHISKGRLPGPPLAELAFWTMIHWRWGMQSRMRLAIGSQAPCHPHSSRECHTGICMRNTTQRKKLSGRNQNHCTSRHNQEIERDSGYNSKNLELK